MEAGAAKKVIGRQMLACQHFRVSAQTMSVKANSMWHHPCTSLIATNKQATLPAVMNTACGYVHVYIVWEQVNHRTSLVHEFNRYSYK